MTIPPLQNEIKSEFEDRFEGRTLTDASLKKYYELCTLYKTKADDLISYIEAELFSNQFHDVNSEKFLQQVQSHLQKQSSKATQKAAVATARAPKRGKRQRAALSAVGGAKASTQDTFSQAPPALDDAPTQSQLPQSYAAYRERKNRGTVDHAFGTFQQSSSATRRGGLSGVKQLRVLNVSEKEKSMFASVDHSKMLYMYDNMNQKSDLLADRVLDMGEALRVVIEQDVGAVVKQEGDKDTEDRMEDNEDRMEDDSKDTTTTQQNPSNLSDSIEYQNFGIVTGGEALYLGRVLCESITGLSRLNLHSVLLEGFIDDEHNKSMIYKLDLSEYSIDAHMALFPGQVIAVQGLLSVRGVLKVSKIYTDVGVRPKPIRFDSGSNVESQAPGSQKKHHVNMMIACGPYTPSNNISYEPFTDLLQVVQRNQPDLLILMGPFVDTTQKLIASPELDETYDDLFVKRIVQPLQTMLPQNTRAVLIPALSDAHHDFVYPQPAFERRTYSITSNQVETHTNPSLFSMDEFGGLTVGASSFAVLQQLQSLQYVSHTPKDLYAQLASHLVQQQSFYPVMMNTNQVPLDYSHSRHRLDFSEAPHVLIVPNKDACARFLENGTLVVSPRALTRSETGGSFVELDLELGEEEIELSEKNISVRVLNI